MLRRVARSGAPKPHRALLGSVSLQDDKGEGGTATPAQRIGADEALARQTHVTFAGAAVNVGLSVSKGVAGVLGGSVSVAAVPARAQSNPASTLIPPSGPPPPLALARPSPRRAGRA